MTTPVMPSADPGPDSTSGRRRWRWLVPLVIALVVLPVVGVTATVINTDRYILTLGQVERENVYVAALAGVVDGRIEGDLVIATGDLHISGDIEGDVLVAARGRVTVTGSIRGSLRGVARSVMVSGTVGEEIAVATMSLAVPGTVGRDILAMGASVDISGRVGRDVLGRGYDVTVSGVVGRDVDMTVRNFTISGTADIHGDAVYKSRRDAVISPDATIGGQIIDLPPGAGFFVAVVLRLTFLLGFFGYIVTGVLSIWLFRDSAAAATQLSADAPLRSLGMGLAVLIGLPIVIGLLGLSLAGLASALVLLVAVLLALLVGSVPFVTVVGERLLRGRGGEYGGFVLAGTLWWALGAAWPVAAALVAAVAVPVGVGGWVLGAAARRSDERFRRNWRVPEDG